MTDDTNALIAATLKLDEEATEGPWSWQGEDYRGGWGWQLLVGARGEGLIVGEASDGSPCEHLRAGVPVEPTLCITGLAADGKPRVNAIHVLEGDAALIAAYRTSAPVFARLLLAEREARKRAEKERDESSARLQFLVPRAGKTMLAVIDLFRQMPQRTRAEIVGAIDAPAKEISNVLAYLVRKQRISRPGYGLYDATAARARVKT